MAKKHSRRKKKVIRTILLVLGLLLLIVFIAISPKVVKVIQLKSDAESLVSQSTSNTFKSTQTTVVYDINANELCTMRNAKDMYYVEYAEIPTYIVNAFIVTEDKKFYNHGGIDIMAIGRAIIANQQSDYVEQGASTITQQLARNIFLTQDVTWNRKIEEMFVAIDLEKKYSKNDILEFYLNNIYFANGYYGVEAAARGYFDKSIGELTLSQQAFLAAIPNSPTKYNPIENYDNTLARRNLILAQMYQDDKISTMNYYSAKEEIITIKQPESARYDYVETYVRHCATESMMSSYGFIFSYNFQSEDEYNYYQTQYDSYYSMCQQKLLSGGYSIYTSIDLSIQDKLQASIDGNLSGFTSISEDGVYELQGAATCIDNLTGNVVAIVGGRSQNLAGYTLNRAYQSYRQPGSSIKPLNVYTPYLQLGNTPDTIVTDESIDNGPANADNTYAGRITLRDAVKYSKNTVAWKIYTEITPKAGSSFLIKMGFKKIYVDKEYVAGSLGGFTYGVTTEEMAGGYAAIENDGVFRKTTCIVTITDSRAKTIIDETARGTRIYNSDATRMMTDMLKTVVDTGTGKAANIENAIVAGKTGTTNSNKDSWFVGYSKYYTTSVWIGYDMPRGMQSPGGYTSAIWKQFMTGIHEGLTVTDFPTYTVKTETTTKATETTQTQTESNASTSVDSNTTDGSLHYTDVDVDVSGYEDKDVKIKGGDVDATKPTSSVQSSSAETQKSTSSTRN